MHARTHCQKTGILHLVFCLNFFCGTEELYVIMVKLLAMYGENDRMKEDSSKLTKLFANSLSTLPCHQKLAGKLESRQACMHLGKEAGLSSGAL
eukprot:1158470-Pelagomonas_calceolata.AAC.2